MYGGMAQSVRRKSDTQWKLQSKTVDSSTTAVKAIFEKIWNLEDKYICSNFDQDTDDFDAPHTELDLKIAEAAHLLDSILMQAIVTLRHDTNVL